MSDINVDDTKIEVRLPLPLDVAASITSAFGCLWPNAVIDTKASNSGYLTMRIPHDDRCKTKRAATKIRAAKTYLESEIEACVRGFDTDGSMRADATAYLGHTMGAAARAAFEDNAEAINYLEMTVQDRDTNKVYVITAARSESQTPSALHKQALSRIAELESRITEMEGSK
ncbi:hypothetical protein ACU5JM_09590 [Rhodococcus erythropolis]|uniref:hypothetical protein n=1 Tax=Rhodococcus TaxID=1827 RepID=UPI001A29D476|nr:hypothetical protein [Rhodococcus sp. (in: high G+C Gram-positive bacteria)]MBJ7481773.1 hypothetical protein [Rhodococcus sp. (in: high G+C Gram-positive bacteria)]